MHSFSFSAGYWRPLSGLMSLLFLAAGCNTAETPRYEKMPSSETGITFRNELTASPEINIFNYLYFFNGGGVAVGDVNGDDLPDVYFTANQTANKLYLNRGDFRFEDVTEQAGVGGDQGWKTGVTMADVNGDGLLDIYVSQLGDYIGFRGKNQLYINLGTDEKGVPVFENRADQYGLDLVGFSTQAAFFDYDLDGDLDMYQLNHSVHQNGTFGDKKAYEGKRHPTAGDRLMRNDGDVFVDVTEDAGIQCNALGYGLGIAVGDINLDGWPDIYIGNDFHEDDYLYLNNGDGTFRDVMRESIRYTSRFSMGNDLADITGDGYPELVSLDMLPEDPIILKAAAAEDPLDIFNMKLNTGYYPQYARNTLQINQGPLPGDDKGVRFSETGIFSGIHATDWSWSALFMDMDNDSWQDIFIANGILGRSNDMDYINFMSDDDLQMRLHYEDITEKDLKITELMPKIKLPNYAYRNDGQLRFTNMAQAWGFSDISYSNGTAYADLDNDGDLDLVINNVNDEAFVYRNRTNQLEGDDHHFLAVKLEGEAPNTFGIGAKLIATQGDRLLVRELMPTRGYQSSVDPRLHLGLGSIRQLDKLTIVWPDGRFETRSQVAADQRLVFRQQDAGGKFDYDTFRRGREALPWTSPVPNAAGINGKHLENTFFDFNRERLIPFMVSAEGPALAVADVDGDGLEDVYIGGAKWQAGSLWLQQANGSFLQKPTAAFALDSLNEDVTAAFFDVDGDGHQDLMVGSGGNEFQNNHPANDLRLYRNDGKGNFSRDAAAVGNIRLTASCVLPADFDGDGDLDVFVGARALTWAYGKIPDSYLLQNDGKGNFRDVTDTYAKETRQAGMIRGGSWADLNGDKRPDLVLASEWDAIKVFLNDGKGLRQSEKTGLETAKGWWNSITTVDMDGDGDLDFVAGNLGLNSKLMASEEEPVRMYLGDFDDNGQAEQLLTHYLQGKEYLFATRDEVVSQMISLKKKYLKYNDFANADLDEVIDPAKLKAAKLYEVTQLRSVWAENKGNGMFTIHELPYQAQWSTLTTVQPFDFDGDGRQDLAVFGNFYDNNIQMGRYDSSYGLVLQNAGSGKLRAVSMQQSGLMVTGQVRRSARIRLGGGGEAILLVRNNDTPVMLRINQPEAADPN